MLQKYLLSEILTIEQYTISMVLFNTDLDNGLMLKRYYCILILLLYYAVKKCKICFLVLDMYLVNI